MREEKITVVMPVRNGIPFVSAAVNSILEQSYHNIEFIIVDDGSTDGTYELLNEYAKEDNRIQLLRRTGHSGLVNALNYGIQNSTGNFVARMDADDISSNDRLATQYNYLKRHPQVGMVCSCANLIDERGEPLKSERNIFNGKHITLMDLLTGYNPIIHPSVMFRRDLFTLSKGYRAEFETCEDLDLWIRFVKMSTIHMLSEPLLNYRVHQSSVSYTKTWKQLLLTQYLTTYQDDELLHMASVLQSLDEVSARKFMSNKTLLRILAIAADARDNKLVREYMKEYLGRNVFTRMLVHGLPYALFASLARRRSFFKRIIP